MFDWQGVSKKHFFPSLAKTNIFQKIAACIHSNYEFISRTADTSSTARTAAIDDNK